jgi:hypothetical protein
MPPKHRPTPPIPGTFEFLTTPRWLLNKLLLWAASPPAGGVSACIARSAVTVFGSNPRSERNALTAKDGITRL